MLGSERIGGCGANVVVMNFAFQRALRRTNAKPYTDTFMSSVLKRLSRSSTSSPDG
jgi:hypothetical protein